MGQPGRAEGSIRRSAGLTGCGESGPARCFIVQASSSAGDRRCSAVGIGDEPPSAACLRQSIRSNGAPVKLNRTGWVALCPVLNSATASDAFVICAGNAVAFPMWTGVKCVDSFLRSARRRERDDSARAEVLPQRHDMYCRPARSRAIRCVRTESGPPGKTVSRPYTRAPRQRARSGSRRPCC